MLNAISSESLGPQLFIGLEPREEQFRPATNLTVAEFRGKPDGGLWTSTYVDGTSSWVEWCEDEQWVNIELLEWWILTPRSGITLLCIDSVEDLAKVVDAFAIIDPRIEFNVGLDFEGMRDAGYGGVHLTDKGVAETRYTYPLNLIAWDVESTVWFDWVFDEKRCVYVPEKGFLSIE